MTYLDANCLPEEKYSLIYPLSEILDGNESVPSATCRIMDKYLPHILKKVRLYDFTETHSQTGKTQLCFWILYNGFPWEGGNLMAAKMYDWVFQDNVSVTFLMEMILYGIYALWKFIELHHYKFCVLFWICVNILYPYKTFKVCILKMHKNINNLKWFLGAFLKFF